jgi:uncharacterized membrane protein
MLSDIMQTLQDPHARHALLVHFPIVLSIAGFLLTVALAVTLFKNHTLRWVAVTCFVVGSIGAGLAANAGEAAEHRIEDTLSLTAAEDEAISAHESIGEGGWMWPLGAGALVALTAVPKRKLQIGAGVLALAAGAGVSVWVGWTGHTGGAILYEYGLGVPARGTALPGNTPGNTPGASSADLPREHADADDD